MAFQHKSYTGSVSRADRFSRCKTGQIQGTLSLGHYCRSASLSALLSNRVSWLVVPKGVRVTKQGKTDCNSHITRLMLQAFADRREPMNSTKNTARLAGLLWFLSAVTGGLGLFYVRSSVIVVGDAAATAANIVASESLYRAAIVSSLFSQIFLFFFGLTLF